MTAVTIPSYEELYYSLWELSCRFAEFVNFRVIGCTHDKRYIPMLEIGTGGLGFFCVCGIQSKDYRISAMVPQILQSYCRAFEEHWEIGHFYQVRKLFTQAKLWVIPFLNPDGYEICRLGYTALRNPGLRQRLRTESPFLKENYDGNGRGNSLQTLFLEDPEKELYLENENHAMLSCIQEFCGEGLLHLTTQVEKERTGISSCAKKTGWMFHSESRHVIRCLKHVLEEEGKPYTVNIGSAFPEGTLENYYANRTGNPSIQMRIPSMQELSARIIARYPLECLYSVLE